ncbi:TetR/AcrR family transcriptional regulator [Amycolatopsis sp. GM8]|uniref:TetR/AcrR family transcriptional regulator n=1 Tax=Amycolatopsis sp. GM8 TaxID=2896530 RepID=UPI001F40CB5E|nr:helix-turn-helix domain-containing protein [Amycolatopsis sp. GM8]
MNEERLGLRERKKLEAWRTLRTEAYRLFARHGYEAVSVEDIAAAANMSRSTFFNYFTSKDAVLRDPEPGDRERWLALFDRPADEPLWDSLVVLLLEFAKQISEFLTTMKRLELQSPALTERTLDRTHPFYRDLRDWVDTRTKPGDELESALVLNVALAAAETAYAHWEPTVDFAGFLRTALECLERAGAGVARHG